MAKLLLGDRPIRLTRGTSNQGAKVGKILPTHTLAQFTTFYKQKITITRGINPEYRYGQYLFA